MSDTGTSRTGRSIAIVGAGIAGMSAGGYAQMNGYRSRIYEMHTQPSGLCTAWQRKGYTIDYCIHWLSGSKPGGSMYRLWEEIGLVRGVEFVDLDEFYRYVSEVHRDLYERDVLPLFSSLLFVGVGVARSFAGEPQVMTGIDLPLIEPLAIGERTYERLHARIHNFDPTLAPEGKTAITCAFEADEPYWAALRAADPGAYAAKKKRVTDAVVRTLDRRYPGLAAQVEMTDVSTPATLVRYTGNWQGSFEGWLPTPEWLFKQVPRTLPGLDGFWMVGQWVAPGGGLPSGPMSARQVQQLICKRDGVKFRTSVV